MEKSNVKGMSVASLTLGIISVCTALLWYMSLVTGILAIVFGAKATKRSQGKNGKAGLVLGIIGVSLTALIYVGLTILIVMATYF